MKLIIELDGGSHELRAEHDDERTRWLQAQQYCVLRFRNSDVFDHTDAVLEAILRECGHPVD